jgi:hypothetical protein
VEVPFGIALQPIKGQTLLESYTGVYVSVKYAITAILEVKGGPKAPSSFTSVFLVEVPVLSTQGQGSGDRPTGQGVPFTISPATLDNPQRLAETCHFAMEGSILHDCYSMDEYFQGYVSVRDADQPIRSIDLQMIRIETIRGGEQQLKKATEILNLQVADGNVRRHSNIPLYLCFPKQFSCPTTYYKHFKIEFEVNLLVTFQNGLLITKNFPIRLYR